MSTRFILGPAGSGKTFRCLAEIRAELARAAEGPPLLLIAPKQTTYQLERLLVEDETLAGYTRLHILSFERLASFVYDELKLRPPDLLDEEGRLMVLRGLLAQKQPELKLFRATARLTGFAQQLSEVLRELQRQQMTPESLAELAGKTRGVEGLSRKLEDFSLLLREYLHWLTAKNLLDADQILDLAAQALREPGSKVEWSGVWVDGFSELSPQELDLLAEVIQRARGAVVTFCLDQEPREEVSWLSTWAVGRRAFEDCRKRLAELPGRGISVELLARDDRRGRFAGSAVLRHLESRWASAEAFAESDDSTGQSLRVAVCADAEAEAVLAAREILRFVRAGGRFREATVLARSLRDYHAPLANVFARYGIPFFLDRREPVGHHPLAELTRNALRTVAFSWAHEDWFAALKTGLVPAADGDIDQLENEALARGWKGAVWQQAIALADAPELGAALEAVRERIMPPFKKLAQRFAHARQKPSGPQLAEALREFWSALAVEETLRSWSDESAAAAPIHLTVWEEMNAWLRNVELAFPAESLPLKEWLPILEAGLSGLAVGVIPPALDQVFLGTIDRSRNPDLRLAIVLGLNENVFPAPPESSTLLTETDRGELERQGIQLTTARRQLGRERHYGYIACTRARERLVLTSALTDAAGRTLNPSPFLAELRLLFPGLRVESAGEAADWRDCAHASELIAPLLRQPAEESLAELAELPAVAPLLDRLRRVGEVAAGETLSPALAARLYGAELNTSVSRMEQFAACPFKFFVHSGLRAEERKRFEIDARTEGNYQHEILARFHEQLRLENKHWRDLTPEEARERIRVAAAELILTFRDGLLMADARARFTARTLVESLQDFVEIAVGWMRSQYAFDPVAVELPFNGREPGALPAWELALPGGRALRLNGRIDRIDLHQETPGAEALCVVVDYKSSGKRLDPVLMANGVQLQLAAYLAVLRHCPDTPARFHASRLIPAGVFYVPLRGKYESSANRGDSLGNMDDSRRAAYRHTGRFDAAVLPLLDCRDGAESGDQFNYRRTKSGALHAGSREALDSAKFAELLAGVENSLQRMGAAVYAGQLDVDPYRKGTFTPCEYCEYLSICRLDPWTHQYRILSGPPEEAA